jgi:hypothetical protein
VGARATRRSAELVLSTRPRDVERVSDGAIRIADQLGIANIEMETKARYEQAMRAGAFVVRVPADTDEQKSQVVDVLRRHRAHGISHFGKFTIERIEPHKKA